MRGLFITFEGTEGSGKSTQIQLLAERLKHTGAEVLAIREPGGTAVGEEIRQILKHTAPNRCLTPEAELLLMNASRAQLVREKIHPALERGQIVLCDRFYDSSVVYQGYARGLNLSEVRAAIAIAVGETRPDLTLLLRIPLETSESRRSRRNVIESSIPDRFEEADRAFFERVERGYQAILQEEPGRIKSIDGTGTVQQIQAAIWECVYPRLAGRETPIDNASGSATVTASNF